MLMVGAVVPKEDGASGETRTLMVLPPVDFESTASTIPPHSRPEGECKGKAFRMLALILSEKVINIAPLIFLTVQGIHHEFLMLLGCHRFGLNIQGSSQ